MYDVIKTVTLVLKRIWISVDKSERGLIFRHKNMISFVNGPSGGKCRLG